MDNYIVILVITSINFINKIYQIYLIITESNLSVNSQPPSSYAKLIISPIYYFLTNNSYCNIYMILSPVYLCLRSINDLLNSKFN